jgi:hypothetical protein
MLGIYRQSNLQIWYTGTLRGGGQLDAVKRDHIFYELTKATARFLPVFRICEILTRIRIQF